MKTLLLSVISVAVLLSVLISAWGLLERTDMKIEIAALNSKIENMEEEIKELKSKPSQPAAPGAAPARVIEKVVSLDNDPMKGDPKAPVTIVEFSDYECPFCRRSYENVFTKLDEEYIKTGKVRMVFRDFPLGFHQKAIPAAIAANCAGEQGKYWEVHNFLFQNPDKLGTEYVLNASDELGLDKAKLTTCMNDKSKEKEITEDFKAGQEYGVRGTPSYFIGKTTDDNEINGVFVRGAQPYSVFKEHIESILKTSE